jgi:ribosomal protein L7/L12
MPVDVAGPPGEDGTPSERLRGEIERLLQKRNKIGAITLHRKVTGAGLKEAKDAVEAIERGTQPGSDTRPTFDRAEIERLLQKRNKLLAIKVYRTATGAGLKDAKDAVDEIERSMSLGPDIRSTFQKVFDRLRWSRDDAG